MASETKKNILVNFTSRRQLSVIINFRDMRFIFRCRRPRSAENHRPRLDCLHLFFPRNSIFTSTITPTAIVPAIWTSCAMRIIMCHLSCCSRPAAARLVRCRPRRCRNVPRCCRCVCTPHRTARTRLGGVQVGWGGGHGNNNNNNNN